MRDKRARLDIESLDFENKMLKAKVSGLERDLKTLQSDFDDLLKELGFRIINRPAIRFLDKSEKYPGGLL